MGGGLDLRQDGDKICRVKVLDFSVGAGGVLVWDDTQMPQA